MNSILKAIKAILNPQPSMLTHSDSAVPKVESKEPLPMDIYQDLPDIGNDRAEIIALISRAFPEGDMYPNLRHNRRGLYKSIHFLRTASKRKWVYDVDVQRGEYTEDKLSKAVAPTQHSHLRAV